MLCKASRIQEHDSQVSFFLRAAREHRSRMLASTLPLPPRPSHESASFSPHIHFSARETHEGQHPALQCTLGMYQANAQGSLLVTHPGVPSPGLQEENKRCHSDASPILNMHSWAIGPAIFQVIAIHQRVPCKLRQYGSGTSGQNYCPVELPNVMAWCNFERDLIHDTVITSTTAVGNQVYHVDQKAAEACARAQLAV